MKINIKAVHHVCLVVKDMTKSENFYVNVLGLEHHHKVRSWLVLNETSSIHLVNIPEAEADASLYHEVQHFALQVENLNEVRSILLDGGLKPFQMDFEGNVKEVASKSAELNFGIGTLFVYDPDGNLVEFLQLGVGAFQLDSANRA
jgi:catechol 2,3-dioxygenase-like lactoylglutathione lyase family enzyme